MRRATARDYCGEAEACRKADRDRIVIEAEIARLANLKPVEYERERKAAAERLEMRASILDKLVRAERPDSDDKQGRAISFPEPAPWPESVDGAALLDSIADAIGRHVVMSEHSRVTAALWIAHTYLLNCFTVTPRLAICSPTKRCGKTTLLDVITRLVLKPLPTANVTAAAVFRVVEAYRPSLLVDEADTFLKDNDELRGIINSGHRAGGSVLRTVGDDHEPRAFSTYAPCAIALIGKLPDTLHDRAVAIDLKRRLPDEKIEQFRSDRTAHLNALARKAARWAADNAGRIADLDPEMPAGVYNREADNWRPLLAIADSAGGRWPERAREAAARSRETADDDRVAVLLADLKAIFTDRKTDRLLSSEMVKGLVEIEGRPWAEYGKTRKPLSQNQLARLLKPLGIAPDNIRVGDKVPKGYRLERFTEAFERYLPARGASEPLHRYNADETLTSDAFRTATGEADVADQKCEKLNNHAHCSGVADGKGGGGEEARVCNHCGGSGQPGEPVQECWFAGDRILLHRKCEAGWLATPDPNGWTFNAPDPPTGDSGADLILGLAPGQRCELCGAGRDVFLIRSHEGEEPAPVHKDCAARAWGQS